MPNDRQRQIESRYEPPNAGGPVTAGVWEHLRTFVRHRWWAAAGFVGLALPVAAFTLMMTPVFQGTTRVLISEDTPRVGLSDQVRDTPQNQVDPQTQTQVVRSRTLARDVVQVLKLWEAPEFREYAVGNDDAARSQSLVDPFLARLSVTLIPDSRVVAIGFESEDPSLAARGANTVAERFIERERESKFQSATQAAEFYNSQLATQRAQVSAAETALQQYRANQNALSLSERQNVVGQTMLDLNASVTRATTDRLQKETQYRQIEAIRTDMAALESHPLIAVNPFVQSLKTQASELNRQDAQLAERLGPKHPDRVQIAAALESVQSRLRAEIGKVVNGIEAEYKSATAQEASVTQALNRQKGQALELDRKGVEYQALEREAVSARLVYDALLQQTKEATIQSSADRGTIRVVDPAEPPGAPIRPRKGQGLAAAALLGIIGAAGGAFGREYMRRKIHSPADLERRLGLPRTGDCADGHQRGGRYRRRPVALARRGLPPAACQCHAGVRRQRAARQRTRGQQCRAGRRQELCGVAPGAGTRRRRSAGGAHRRRPAPPAASHHVRPAARARALRRPARPAQHRRGAAPGRRPGPGTGTRVDCPLPRRPSCSPTRRSARSSKGCGPTSTGSSSTRRR